MGTNSIRCPAARNVRSVSDSISNRRADSGKRRQRLQVRQAEAALRIRQANSGQAGKPPAHPTVHLPAQPRHGRGVCHAIAYHQRGGVVFGAGKELWDVVRRVLAIAVHHQRPGEPQLAGAAPAGSQSGSLCRNCARRRITSAPAAFASGAVASVEPSSTTMMLGKCARTSATTAPTNGASLKHGITRDALTGPIHESRQHNLPWRGRQRQFRFILSARMVASEAGLCYDCDWYGL